MDNCCDLLYSLLVAIGIEAFNRLSQLKNEEKDIKKKKSVVDQQPLVENKQEDQYSTVSEILSNHHVCVFYALMCIIYKRMYVGTKTTFTHKVKICC